MSNLTREQELQRSMNRVVYGDFNGETGNQFYSKYYGKITSTKNTRYENDRWSIYGFDEKGDPRSEYYPKDLNWLGFPINIELIVSALAISLIEFDLISNDDFAEININENISFKWHYCKNVMNQENKTLSTLIELFLEI